MGSGIPSLLAEWDLLWGKRGAGAGRACAVARIPSLALHSVLELQSSQRARPTDLRAPVLVDSSLRLSQIKFRERSRLAQNQRHVY